MNANDSVVWKSLCGLDLEERFFAQSYSTTIILHTSPSSSQKWFAESPFSSLLPPFPTRAYPTQRFSEIVLKPGWVKYSLTLASRPAQLRAFLSQRVSEMDSQAGQLAVSAPDSLQQATVDSVRAMETHVAEAIGLLTNRRTRDLIMITHSPK